MAEFVKGDVVIVPFPYKAGQIKSEKLGEVIAKIVEIIQQ